MTSWCEVEARLSKKKTTGIDKIHQEMLYSETKRRIQVFQVAIVQYQAERNLVFKVSIERVGEPNYGNFLGLVELLAKFDPVMGEIFFDMLLIQKITINTLGRRFKTYSLM
jgi:hypothetical protein